MTGTESHQGVAAFASEIAYATVEDLLAAPPLALSRWHWRTPTTWVP